MDTTTLVGTAAGLVGLTCALPWLIPSKKESGILSRTQEHNKIRGLSVKHAPENPDIDICFVHGLTGDALSTWTAPGTKTEERVFWPTDYLTNRSFPKGDAFPQARILLYGYETQINSLCWLTEKTLYHHGNHLLGCLKEERKLCRSRPLVFVAHSLGGLVVKSALIFASSIRSSISAEEHDIYSSTIGIVSFGTPQIYAGNAPLTKTIGYFLPQSKDSQRFEDFESDRWQDDVKKLQKRLDRYKPIIMDIPEVFCFESETALGTRERAVPKPFMKGTVHELCVAVRIDADHENMCKFRTQSEDFQKIRTSIQKFYEKSSFKPRRRRTGLMEPSGPATSLQRVINQRKFHIQTKLPDRINFVSRTSRKKYLKELDAQLRDKRHAVLTGDRGNGKSTIALELAYRSQENFAHKSQKKLEEDEVAVESSAVFWIDASSRSALDRSFMKIFRRLRDFYLYGERGDAQQRWERYHQEPEHGERMRVTKRLRQATEQQTREMAIQDNPATPEGQHQPPEGARKDQTEDTSTAFRQTLDSVLENEDGSPRTEEDRKFVIRFVSDWLYYPGNDSWLLVYDDAEDSRAPYLQEYLQQKRSDFGYVVVTSRGDDPGSVNTRTNRIEISPFDPEERDSELYLRSGIYAEPMMYDDEDGPHFMGPDPTDEEKESLPKLLRKTEPIKVGSFDHEESVDLMENITDDAQLPLESQRLLRRQTFKEYANKLSNNPSDITYAVGGAFERFPHNALEQIERDLRPDFHLTQPPSEYVEWLDASVMLGSAPIPWVFIQEGFGIDRFSTFTGLKELYESGWVWLNRKEKTFKVWTQRQRERRQQFWSTMDIAHMASKAIINTVKYIRKTVAKDEEEKGFLESVEEQLVLHMPACWENCRDNRFQDCQWDILADFCEKHGLYKEALSFYRVAYDHDVPNSDSQTVRSELRYADNLDTLDAPASIATPLSRPSTPSTNGRESNNSRKLRSRLGIIRVQVRLGQYAGLEEECTSLLSEIASKQGQPYFRLRRDTLSQLILIRKASEDWTGAIQSSYELIKTLEKHSGPSADDSLEALHKLAGIHMSQGDFAGATPVLEQVIMYREVEAGNAATLKLLPVYEDLARAHREQGNLDIAQDLYMKIIERLRDVVGNEHIRTAKVKENLAFALDIRAGMLRDEGERDRQRKDADFWYKDALHAASLLGPGNEEFRLMDKRYKTLLQKRERDRRRTEQRSLEYL